MLKPFNDASFRVVVLQPPSGGCVLKPIRNPYNEGRSSAAFRRLCVETAKTWYKRKLYNSRLQAAVC